MQAEIRANRLASFSGEASVAWNCNVHGVLEALELSLRFPKGSLRQVHCI